MGLFSKKEKVPEISHTSELPDLPKKEEGHNLPELPKVPTAHSLEEKKVDMGPPPHIMEYPIPPKPSEDLIPRVPKVENHLDTKEIEPIFVRIDRFQSAQKSFDVIKSRLKEMESVLKKIKDVKSKEDKGIASWNEEVEKIKERLSEIDSDIFDQI